MIARMIPKAPTDWSALTQLQADSQQPNKWSGTSKQPKTINQPSDRGQATYPRAVGSQQSKQLIWERLDRK